MGDRALLATALAFVLVVLAQRVAAHPEHVSIAEAELNPATGVIEVAMRFDAVHLEETLSAFAGERIDIENEDGAARIFALLQSSFEVRTSGGRDCPLHWVGRELDGLDVWLFFEVRVPWIIAGTPHLEVRHRTMLEHMPQQVNLVSFIVGSDRTTVRFAADDRNWQRIELAPLEVWLDRHRPHLGRVTRRGTGKVRLVLLPEVGCDGRLFETFMAARTDRYEMHAVTLAGFGKTPPPPTAASSPWRADGSAAVGSLVDALDGPAILVTHGRSLAIAREVAASRAPRVTGIVHVTGPTAKTVPSPAAWRRTLADAAGTNRAVIEAMLAMVTDEVLARYLAEVAAAPAAPKPAVRTVPIDVSGGAFTMLDRPARIDEAITTLLTTPPDHRDTTP